MLYIHIGFHKTGSSTIQHFLAANADLLASHGMIYPRAGRHTTAHFNLTAELMEKVTFSNTKGSWDDLRAEMAASPNSDFVISSEAFHTLRPEQVSKVREMLGDHEVVVCAYIRDLGDTLVSRYGQKAKSGSYIGSFDEFFEGVSNARGGDQEDDYGGTYIQLARWADVFGWDAMRVRALDPRDLVGGDLISDLLAALKLDRPEIVAALDQATAATKNAALGWKTLELIRAVHVASGGLRAERGLRRLEKFRGIRKVATRIRRSGEVVGEEIGLGNARAQYLTPAQWRSARAQYVSDLQRLNAAMAHQIPEPNSPEPPERSFLPEASAVPADERARFNERMLFELIPYIALNDKDDDADGTPSPKAASNEKRAKRAAGDDGGADASAHANGHPRLRASGGDDEKAARQAAKQALRASKRKEREERQGGDSKRLFKRATDRSE